MAFLSNKFQFHFETAVYNKLPVRQPTKKGKMKLTVRKNREECRTESLDRYPSPKSIGWVKGHCWSARVLLFTFEMHNAKTALIDSNYLRCCLLSMHNQWIFESLHSQHTSHNGPLSIPFRTMSIQNAEYSGGIFGVRNDRPVTQANKH